MSRAAVHSRASRRKQAQPSPAHTPAWPWLTAIAILTAFAYLPSFRGEFIVDDYLSIVNNGRIRQLSPVSEFLKDTRPVCEFTFALNYAFGGLDRWGFHAGNLLVHTLAVFTLFGVVRRTLLLPQFAHWTAGQVNTWSAVVASIWAVHPLNTQAVTYIVQRSESLMALFYLLTMYLLIRGFRSSRSLAWYIATVAACALGMGSKAVMVTAPVVLFLFDGLFLSTGFKSAMRVRWPLYVCLTATATILWRVGVIGGLYIKDQGEAVTVGFAMEGITPRQYGLTQLGVLLHYLKLAVWPHPLCIDYGWSVAKSLGEIVPGAIVIGSVAIGSTWAFMRRHPFGILGLAFLIILSPTSSIVPIRDIAFEHRMYLPLAAVVCAAVFSVRWVIVYRTGSHYINKRLTGMVWGLAIALLTGLTYQRNSLYSDPVGLWEQNVAQTPNNPRPINALGNALFRKGRYEEARARFDQAISINPYFAGTYANLGFMALAQKRATEAADWFKKAEDTSPNEFGTDFLFAYGTALLESGQIKTAIEKLSEAVRVDPDFQPAAQSLGIAYLQVDRAADALLIFERLVQSGPVPVEVLVNLGLAQSRTGRIDAAIRTYRRALGEAGISADVRFKLLYNMGLALISQGSRAEAAEVLRQALSLNAQHEGARKALESAIQPRQ